MFALLALDFFWKNYRLHRVVDTNQVIAAIHPPQDRLQPESDDTLTLGFLGEALLVFGIGPFFPGWDHHMYRRTYSTTNC